MKADMTETSLIRWSGVCCMLAGAAIAGFVLVHPWDQLLGAEVARSGRWRLAHTLHFFGALFAIPGLLGIFGYARERLGNLGLAGMLVTLLGTAMFLGTGMITAFIWPMLAQHAPATVEPGGPIFHGTVSPIAFLITAGTNICGYVMLGVALMRGAIFPRLAVVLLTAGAVLGMLPPTPVSPFPWSGLVLGGVLYGVAMVWLGIILWRARGA